jgi:hypothetical protein
MTPLSDTATNREICREGVYKTGLLLTMRPLPKDENGHQPVEVVGQSIKLRWCQTWFEAEVRYQSEVSLQTPHFRILSKLERTKPGRL